MSGFSPDWLKLREPADLKARNRDVANVLSARFALRDRVSVIDLGCGTGSNLRGTSHLLPDVQTWTLVDYDPQLLETARRELSIWADSSEAGAHGETGSAISDDAIDGIVLRKGSATITVSFLRCDLATNLKQALNQPVDLVTAAALFDLVSEEFIQRFARHVADMRATFYTVMTCNGLQRWQPHRPADNEIQSAFQRHQMGDKGFGPAAGPLAASVLIEQFGLNGYLVSEGSSPWVLSRNDRMLIDEMVRGHAMAASDTGLVDIKTVENWVKVARTAAETGHTDVCAVPTATVGF